MSSLAQLLPHTHGLFTSPYASLLLGEGRGEREEEETRLFKLNSRTSCNTIGKRQFPLEVLMY